MSNYKASIVCTVFNEKYEFEDILLIGIANNKDEACALLMGDIFRVMKDFGLGKCEIEESRSVYDEPITIVHTHDASNEGLTMHWHYYCLLDNHEAESEDKECR